MLRANDEHVTDVSVTSVKKHAKASCMGRKVENEDALVLVLGHALFEGAVRGARKGTFDDGFHRLPMLLAREAVTQASAANPLDGSRIVRAIGLQWVAEKVKAMAAMDVVLAAVVVRDELANERLAALTSDAERAAFLARVSMKDAKERAQQMSALGVFGSKMSQERTYIWWAVVMWCKSWLLWHLFHARRTGGTPVDTRLWQLLLFMGHRLDQLQDLLVDADGPSEQALAPADASVAAGGRPGSGSAAPLPVPGTVSPVGGLGVIVRS